MNFNASTATTEATTPADLAARFISHTNRHVFLTGKAGTGKTTFLRSVKDRTFKKMVIAAPTGVAAINAGGVTLHSLFQLPFGTFIPDNSRKSFLQNDRMNTPYTLLRNLHIRGTKKRLLQELELLVIDEVSMLRADILDAIDTVLRAVRRSDKPFGGVQLLLIGDLMQLPPVVKDEEWNVLQDYYSSIFFFEALALKHKEPVYIELDKIYRQQDQEFIRVLNHLRDNELTEEDMERLNECYQQYFRPEDNEEYICLTTHNYKADNINKRALQKLESDSHFYTATVEGDFSEYAYPVEHKMELKRGARVMFIKNDPTGEQRFFNGKIGSVSQLDEDEITVSFPDGSEPVTVERYEWQNVKYTWKEEDQEVQEEVVGKFLQFPLRLAWAITVHKSQGLTFEKAMVDIADAFAPGQVYVALSRLTSLDGLVLTSGVRQTALKPEESLRKFFKVAEQQQPAEETLDAEASLFLKDTVIASFNLYPLYRIFRTHITTYDKSEQRSEKQKHLQWAVELSNQLEPPRDVAEKFLNQLKRLFVENDLQRVKERAMAAEQYFKPALDKVERNIAAKLDELGKIAKTKKFKTELTELSGHVKKQKERMAKACALVESVMNGYSPLPQKEKPAPKDVVEEAKQKEKKPKREKGQTQLESLALYHSGLSIEEIAEKRGYTISTIEGHLAKFIKEGKLDVLEFLKEEDLKIIAAAAASVDEGGMGAVKAKLGQAFTYGQIRMAMAHLSQQA